MKIEDIKRDREAGTPGEWEYRTGPALNGRYHTVYVQNEDDPMVCECWEGDEGFQENCARRIARVPELEAAFLEAVELLGKVGSADPWSRDVIDFLERFK